MAKQNICVRVDEEMLGDIDRLVSAGIYSTRTDFVLECIDEKLNPERSKRARVNRILYEMKNNPEIREELAQIIREIRN